MAERATIDNDTGVLGLGARVRAARAKAGMTRRQLAAASGTSERYLANIESGIGNPSLDVLTGLAAALDLPVAELIPLGGERDIRRAEAAALLRRLSDARLTSAISWLQNPAASGGSTGRIVLVGLRGAGKSSLGSALAQRLGMPFVEMSKEVEREYGGEIGLLIELGGQGALKRYEHQAWERIVADHEAAVIATPGGIVSDPVLYDRIIATAHSIWLTARPEDHMTRVMAQGDFRPMAANKGAMDDLKAILEARQGDYARAQAKIDTSRADFDATLDELEKVARRMAAKYAI